MRLAQPLVGRVRSSAVKFWSAAIASAGFWRNNLVIRLDAASVSPIDGLLITSAPPTKARSAVPPSIPAAAKAAIMLVEQASTAEKAGTVGSRPASSQISRPILLQPRLGITVPQTKRSGRAFAAIACASGTDRLIAS